MTRAPSLIVALFALGTTACAIQPATCDVDGALLDGGAACGLSFVAEPTPEARCGDQGLPDVPILPSGAFNVAVTLRDARLANAPRALVEILETPAPSGARVSEIVQLAGANGLFEGTARLVWPSPGTVRIRVRAAGHEDWVGQAVLVPAPLEIEPRAGAVEGGLVSACAIVTCNGQVVRGATVSFATVPSLPALPATGITDADGISRTTLAVTGDDAPTRARFEATVGAAREGCTIGTSADCLACPTPADGP